MLRLIFFADRYAVNLLFFDQWSLFSAFFEDYGPWQIFTFQHGPHRQGVGFFLTIWMAKLSGLNTRWDAFAVVGCIVGAGISGAGLAVRCGVSAVLAFIGAGLIFFNLRQYEIFLSAPNLCVGGLPLFLVVLCACSWLIKRPSIRLPLIGVTVFNMIFSGYAIFAGGLIPALLLVELVQAWKAGDRRRSGFVALALGICAAGWMLFSVDYVFMPAGEGFRFPYEKPWEYFYFAAIMHANMVGISGYGVFSIVAGGLIFLSVVAVFLWHGWRLLRHGVVNQPVSAAIFTLAGYGLLYCMSASVGRVMMGLPAALAPRYGTLLIPGVFAVFLHLSLYKWPRFHILPMVSLALFAFGTLALRQAWIGVMWFHNGQTEWKAAYLETRDELEANRRSKFRVFPEPGFVTQRMDYLEKRQLNLFAPE